MILMSGCACRLEKQGRFERAIVCYQEAVTDDPSQEVAKTRLELLKRVLQKKVGNNWDYVHVLANCSCSLLRLLSFFTFSYARILRISLLLPLSCTGDVGNLVGGVSMLQLLGVYNGWWIVSWSLAESPLPPLPSLYSPPSFHPPPSSFRPPPPSFRPPPPSLFLLPPPPLLSPEAAEKVEKERKEAAEKARLKKLHSLIKEEKEKKKKTKAKK